MPRPRTAAYEALTGCRPALLSKAYVAACYAKSYIVARGIYGLLPEAKREVVAQLCALPP
jgi:hypothetical protein